MASATTNKTTTASSTGGAQIRPYTTHGKFSDLTFYCLGTASSRSPVLLNRATLGFSQNKPSRSPMRSSFSSQQPMPVMFEAKRRSIMKINMLEEFAKKYAPVILVDLILFRLSMMGIKRI